MVRKIIWSNRAQTDRKLIFSYWNQRIKSNSFSLKLNSLFISAAEFIALYPRTGKVTDRKSVRIKFVNHFAILYKYSSDEIRILTIFDTRQDPAKLNILIKDKK